MGRKRCAVFTSSKNSTKSIVHKRRKIIALEKSPKLSELPPIVINQIISNLPLDDHTSFRSVCKYFHEEVEVYWRTQKSFSIPKMCHWFPNLDENRKWKLENLNGFSEEISAIFNLMRVGSLEVLDFRGLKALHWTTFVKSIQKYTYESAPKILENVKKLNIVGCTISPKSLSLIAKILPSLQNIIIDQNMVLPKNINLAALKNERFEMCRFKTLNYYDYSVDHRFALLGSNIHWRTISYFSQIFAQVQNIMIDTSL